MLRALVIFSLMLSAFGLGTLGLYALGGETPAPVAATAPAPAEPSRARVLAAARALPPGTLLKDEDLTVREMAPDAVPPGAAPETMRGELRGGLLRRYVEAGEAMPAAEVLRTRDRGFLAAVLRSGHRAISVGVDVVTGTAGLIWPGDQVDVILTQELTAGEAPLGRRVIGETVLSDLRVIAVDQQLTQGTAGAETAQGRVARTVTLEVTSEQAERVAVASRLGRIALTVRAIEPPSDAWPVGAPVFGGDVSPALAGSTVSQGTRMRVIQGEQQQEVVFR
ncbi:Flp pilus assembly protein CpaB [Roseomonas sp. WA12]